MKVAETQIASANAASKDAVAKVSAAEARSAEASAKAEGFRLDIAKAKESAAKAEARAAEANLELEKLKTPRSLNSEQQQRIIVKLRPFAGQKFCFALDPDAESLALMRTVETILTSSGWIKIESQIGPVTVGGTGVVIGSGIQMQSAPNEFEGLKIALEALAGAMSAEHLLSTIAANPELTGKSPKNINIFIGKKL